MIVFVHFSKWFIIFLVDWYWDLWRRGTNFYDFHWLWLSYNCRFLDCWNVTLRFLQSSWAKRSTKLLLSRHMCSDRQIYFQNEKILLQLWLKLRNGYFINLNFADYSTLLAHCFIFKIKFGILDTIYRLLGSFTSPKIRDQTFQYKFYCLVPCCLTFF